MSPNSKNLSATPIVAADPGLLRDLSLCLANHASDGLIVHDHGRILDVNDAIIKLCQGATREQIIGQMVTDLFIPGDRQQIGFAL